MNKALTILIIASLGTILFSINARASSLAFDATGNLFQAKDTEIVKITPEGKRSTFAMGVSSEHLAFDRSGNLFVSEGGGGSQRKKERLKRITRE